MSFQGEGPVDFPKETFGVCPICGGSEKDQTVGLTSADAPARDTNGSGTILYWYKDMFVCEICMNDRKQNSETAEIAEKISDDKQFLAEAGFVQMPQDGNFEGLNPYGNGMIAVPLLDKNGSQLLDKNGNPLITLVSAGS